jgi:hypothetical protein
MGIARAYYHIYVAIHDERALVIVAIEIAGQCLGVNTIQSALSLGFHSEDELLGVGRRCLYFQVVVAGSEK